MVFGGGSSPGFSDNDCMTELTACEGCAFEM